MAVRSARAIVALEQNGIASKQVLTPAAIRNAMVVHAAFGGSTNLLLHIPAIAHAAGLPRPTVDDWIAVNRSVPRLVKAADCQVWSPYYRNLTAALVKEAHDLGLKVIPWTVNEMADLELIYRTGIDGIISDYPDRARAALTKGITPPPPLTLR